MTPAQEAVERLTAWVRDFGHLKEPQFIADVQTLLAEVRRGADAVSEEREACVAALEALADTYDPSDHAASGIYTAADAIRERGIA